MQIRIHSITDLITNSSTTIYTYQNNSEKVFHKLMDEIFKALGTKYKSKDAFDTIVLLPLYRYIDYIDYGCDDKLPDGVVNTEDFKNNFDSIVQKIASKEMKQPKWFTAAKKYFETGDGTEDGHPSYDTVLYVFAKDPKFAKIAELAESFLCSIETDSSR
jgi:hypothetical protein